MVFLYHALGMSAICNVFDIVNFNVCYQCRFGI